MRENVYKYLFSPRSEEGYYGYLTCVVFKKSDLFDVARGTRAFKLESLSVSAGYFKPNTICS